MKAVIKTKTLDGAMGADLLAAVLNNINSAVFIVDENREIIKYNSLFADMFKNDNLDLIESSTFCRNTILCQSKTAADSKSDEDDTSYDDTMCKLRPDSPHCLNCYIRSAIENAIYLGKDTVDKMIGREFIEAGQLSRHYFKYSVKPIQIEDSTYALIIIDDVSDIENTKAELIDQNLKIQKYNDVYREELKLANRVQSSIIPKNSFKAKGYTIDFKYFPLGELGGDMFDYFVIDDSHIGVVLCDVMGHGLASALITTMIKATLESSRQFYTYPERLVKYLNDQMISIFEDAYMTMIYGLIDTDKHEFTFVRAGHPKPWLITKTGVSVMGIEDNVMLGVDPNAKFTKETISIDEGSRVLIFTDGLIDIGHKNSGYEKEIIKLVSDYSGHNSHNFLQGLESNINQRLSERSHEDDICVLAIERTGLNFV